jgi:glycosyltransferase involved in cell wall biosynthesis
MVSVVIPVRNSPERLRACLEGLCAQSYPADRYEVIVVDNGSTDQTPAVARSFAVRVLEENSVVSPYAARNAGMAVARGSILALIDASCIPEPDWLSRGVSALQSRSGDLAGGQVRFTFSEQRSIGELADAFMNVDVEASIANHASCMAGNLFVQRRVVEALGPFERELRSGGDMLWTRRASDAGFKLIYAEDAVVQYPARPLSALLTKQFRVGQGVPSVWTEFGIGRPGMVLRALRGLLPPPPCGFTGRCRRRLGRTGGVLAARVWLAVWLGKVVRSIGNLRGLVDGSAGGSRGSRAETADGRAVGGAS